MALVKWWAHRILAGGVTPGHSPPVLGKNHDALQRATVPAWTVTAKRRARRILRRLLRIGLLPLAVLLRVVLLILKPFVHIRFGQLWSPRLGVFAMVTELYLCEKDAEIQPRRSLDLWYHYDRDRYLIRNPPKPRQAISNQQLSMMFERVLHEWEPARVLDRLNRMLPRGCDDFVVQISDPYDRDDLLHRFPSHLTFTEAEEQRGRSELAKMGIEPDAKFICIHGRDSEYLERVRPRNVAAYGDWGWQNHRDVSIGNYVLAAEKLAELGYYVIRVGKYVKEPFNSAHPRVIDYATQYQSDFMDVFLADRCAFFIGQNSGMIALPMIFRRPTVFVNMFPLWAIAGLRFTNGIAIPRKLYSEQRGRFLTYSEIVGLGIADCIFKTPEQKDLYNALGLRIVENTAEEISEAAMEMHQTLRSQLSWLAEDEELQRRFSSILGSHPGTVPNWGDENRLLRFGAHFLRTNRELLD
jgi:putative glycosyltransferase (TIGR04372 family)